MAATFAMKGAARAMIAALAALALVSVAAAANADSAASPNIEAQGSSIVVSAAEGGSVLFRLGAYI